MSSNGAEQTAAGLWQSLGTMAGGEIVGELSRAEATEERLGLLMAGIRRTEGKSA